MASNMWKAVENVCEVCGVELNSPRRDGEEYEDGTPRSEGGSTIEDENGTYFTLCESCLTLLVNGEFMALQARQEMGR